MKTSIMPHPLYFEGDLPQSVRDIDFLYFGTIKRYKGLSQLLAVWPSEHRFVIAGAVPDPELYAELREIARTRELDVEFIDRFVPDEELNALLLRTRFALLPHLDDAMIVTGCFYHAASLGVNILARNGELSRNLREDFTFVTLFDDATIGRVIGALHYTEADTVVAEIRRTNGVERCREVWRQIIERS
jgi:beta-1,4-mannosyltransferase